MTRPSPDGRSVSGAELTQPKSGRRDGCHDFLHFFGRERGIWAEAGTSTPSVLSDSGSASSTFGSIFTGDVTGTLNQFDIVGAVLLSFRIAGAFEITGAGDIINDAAGDSAGGELELSVANGFLEMPNSVYIGTTDSASATASTSPDQTASTSLKQNFNYTVPQSDWSSILGFSTFDIFGAGTSEFAGGCVSGDCITPEYIHEATFAFLTSGLSGDILRVEYDYCTTPGENGCPDLIIGVNSPDPSQRPVPEPATLLLMGLGLAGLGFARRRRLNA